EGCGFACGESSGPAPGENRGAASGETDTVESATGSRAVGPSSCAWSIACSFALHRGSIIFETPPTWTTLRAGTTNHNPARVLSPPPRQHHPGGFTRYEDRCRRRRRILRLAHCPVPVAEGA